MSVEDWWNRTDRGKPNFLEKSLLKCHSVHLKPDWPEIGSKTAG